MEADVSGPSLAAPQFNRAIPADSARDTPGMHSSGQDLAAGGIRMGCSSEDASL